jgi:hypothetical protein
MDKPAVDEDPIASAFEAEALPDDDSAARDMLAEGRPIHVVRKDTPKGWVIRHWPDGREELVPGSDFEAPGIDLGEREQPEAQAREPF